MERPVERDVAADSQSRVLIVRTAGRRCALPLARILQVAAIARLARIPRAPVLWCGVTSFHGRIVPVLDLARLLGTEDKSAALVATVVISGQFTGLRLSEIEGIRLAEGNDAEELQLDEIELPARYARPTPADANHRRQTETVAAPAERGLMMTVGGNAYWLPLTQIIAIHDTDTDIPVPWADPRVPALMIDGDDALALMRLDLLLGLRLPPNGPIVVARVEARRVGFRVDTIEGITQRGIADVLPLEALLEALPGSEPETSRSRREPSRIAQDAWLAIVLEHQPCLLPLGMVQSVAAASRPAALPAGAPPGLKGVHSIGGRILPVVDQRQALGLTTEQPAGVDIVIAHPGAPHFILTAQQIDGIVRLRPDMIRPTGGGAMIAGVVRLGDRVSWLLDQSTLARSAALRPAEAIR